MYNLHTHSLLSDGVLLPSEIARRYAALGYKIIAITDHVDYSNIEFVVNSILKFTKNWPKTETIKVFPGIELTHLPLEQFKPLAKYARSKGIKIIIGHGETIAEPVVKGTNRAALEADIDILAHPGLITDTDVRFAKERGIFLELTSRRSHRDTNYHVAETALRYGAKLVISHDSHSPEDFISPEESFKIAKDAGLARIEIDKIYKDMKSFLKPPNSI